MWRPASREAGGWVVATGHTGWRRGVIVIAFKPATLTTAHRTLLTHSTSPVYDKRQRPRWCLITITLHCKQLLLRSIPFASPPPPRGAASLSATLLVASGFVVSASDSHRRHRRPVRHVAFPVPSRLEQTLVPTCLSQACRGCGGLAPTPSMRRPLVSANRGGAHAVPPLERRCGAALTTPCREGMLAAQAPIPSGRGHCPQPRDHRHDPLQGGRAKAGNASTETASGQQERPSSDVRLECECDGHLTRLGDTDASSLWTRVSRMVVTTSWRKSQARSSLTRWLA